MVNDKNTVENELDAKTIKHQKKKDKLASALRQNLLRRKQSANSPSSKKEG
jgi:hypothetical protein